MSKHAKGGITEQRVENMSKDDQKAILQEWQTCVSSADTVSQRRDVINGIFVTLCLAVVTSVSVLWGVRAAPLLLAGCVICVAWLCYLWSLKSLNSAKYAVIQQLESFLPKRPYSAEWDLLKNRRYLKGTTIERILPISFITIYLVLLVLIAIGE